MESKEIVHVFCAVAVVAAIAATAVYAIRSLVNTHVVQHADITSQYTIPDALKDCKVYRLVSERWSTATVVQCPTSVTTTQHIGKNVTNTTAY